MNREDWGGPDIILVGFSGSPTSLRAAAYAAGQAYRQHADLVVVAVLPRPASADLFFDSGDWLRRWRDDLRAGFDSLFKQGAERLPGVRSELLIVVGDPYQELVRIAGQRRADLIVVGASVGLCHRFTGSVPARLIRSAICPVTVVP